MNEQFLRLVTSFRETVGFSPAANGASLSEELI